MLSGNPIAVNGQQSIDGLELINDETDPNQWELGPIFLTKNHMIQMIPYILVMALSSRANLFK